MDGARGRRTPRSLDYSLVRTHTAPMSDVCSRPLAKWRETAGSWLGEAIAASIRVTQRPDAFPSSTPPAAPEVLRWAKGLEAAVFATFCTQGRRDHDIYQQELMALEHELRGFGFLFFLPGTDKVAGRGHLALASSPAQVRSALYRRMAAAASFPLEDRSAEREQPRLLPKAPDEVEMLRHPDAVPTDAADLDWSEMTDQSSVTQTAILQAMGVPERMQHWICPLKCGSTEISEYTIQSRSADEPSTTHLTCKCGKKWKVQ